MRFTRIITALLSLALLGLVPFAAASSASATTSTSTTASSTAPSSALAKRTIGVKIVKRKGKLLMVGNVKPPKGPVVIQKATKCNRTKGTCNFKFYKKAKLKKGRYEVRVYAPKSGSWAWRARVGSKTSDIWVTCKRKSSSAPCPTP